MTGKHTPGPWESYERADKDFPRGVRSRYGSGGLLHIASVRWPDDVGEANARLIAAAPDMKALLVELYDAELSPDTLRILQPWFAKVEPIIKATEEDA